MKKLFLALMARALEAQTEDEVNRLCADIDRLYKEDRIRFDENEMLYRLINRLH